MNTITFFTFISSIILPVFSSPLRELISGENEYKLSHPTLLSRSSKEPVIIPLNDFVNCLGKPHDQISVDVSRDVSQEILKQTYIKCINSFLP